MTAQSKYYAGADSISAVATAAAEMAKLRSQLSTAKQKKDTLWAETGCKKPSILAGKKKKDAYNQCLAQNRDKIEKAKQADRDLAKLQAELSLLEKKEENAGNDKILGMNPTTAIWVLGGSIVALFAITLITIKLTKKI